MIGAHPGTAPLPATAASPVWSAIAERWAGNLIGGPDGAVLCDLDTTGVRPAEWAVVGFPVLGAAFSVRRPV